MNKILTCYKCKKPATYIDGLWFRYVNIHYTRPVLHYMNVACNDHIQPGLSQLRKGGRGGSRFVYKINITARTQKTKATQIIAEILSQSHPRNFFIPKSDIQKVVGQGFLR